MHTSTGHVTLMPRQAIASSNACNLREVVRVSAWVLEVLTAKFGATVQQGKMYQLMQATSCDPSHVVGAFAGRIVGAFVERVNGAK